MLSWKWVWLTLGLSGFAFVAVHRTDATTEQASAPASKPTAQQAVAPAAYPVSLPPLAAAPTPSASGYTLDFYARIVAPWYDTVPPNDHNTPNFGAVELGDVTGDRRDDVIGLLHSGANYAALGDVLVYAQKPDYTLEPGRIHPIPAEMDAATFTAIGDFNEDRTQDVVVAGALKFAVYLSKPGGGLEPVVHDVFDPLVHLGSLTPPIVLDANRDGHLDLVFFVSRTHEGGVGVPVAETHSRIVIRYGDGLGGFAGTWSMKTFGTDVYDGETAMSIAPGDLNGDGYRDIAIRTMQWDYGRKRFNHLIRIFAGNAQGQLTNTGNLNAIPVGPPDYAMIESVAIGDFNSDGRADIIGASKIPDQLFIKLQSAAGKFDTAPLIRSTGPSSVPIEISNLDNAGGEDVLIGHDGWARVSYYLQSSGQLGENQTRGIANSDARVGQSGLAIGQLDGDDCKDVAFSQGYYGIFLMRGTNCRPGRRGTPMEVCTTQESIAPPGATLTLGQAPAEAQAMQPMRWSWSDKRGGWAWK